MHTSDLIWKDRIKNFSLFLLVLDTHHLCRALGRNVVCCWTMRIVIVTFLAPTIKEENIELLSLPPRTPLSPSLALSGSGISLTIDQASSN